MAAHTGSTKVSAISDKPGLRMVFMDYKPAKGYAGSKWVGWATFEKVFRDKDLIRALKISIVFNLLDLAVSIPMPIILFANTQVRDYQYQPAIYIYEKGLANSKFHMATAVGL